MSELHTITRGAPDLPPVVFLHGFLGRGEDWGAVMDALAPRHHCIAVDLPGHGKSPALTSLAQFVAGFQRLLDMRGIAQAALVGYSMGGRLALHLAQQLPERIAALALESASPGLAEAEVRAARQARDAQLALELDDLAERGAPLRAFVEAWYAMPLFQTLSPELRTSLIAQRQENDAAALAAALRTFGTGTLPPLWDALPAMPMPVLAIVGELDRKFRHIAEEMSERLPRVAVEVLSGCGHNVHAENSAGYTAVLGAFLHAQGAGHGA